MTINGYIETIKKLHVGRFSFIFRYRTNSNLGRFGGGWNWAVGFKTNGFKKHGCILNFQLGFFELELIYRTEWGMLTKEFFNLEGEARQIFYNKYNSIYLNRKSNKENRRLIRDVQHGRY